MLFRSAQLKEVIRKYQELMGGQLSSLKQQYEVGTGRKDFDERLSPRSRQVISGMTASPGAGAPSIGTVQDGWRFKGGDPADKKNWEKQ